METTEIELDDIVYDMLRDSVPGDAQWLRILMLEERMAGSNDDILSYATQVMVWNAETQKVERQSFTIPVQRRGPVQRYFKRSFNINDWVRVYVTCELDGSNRATVVTDPEGPHETDYMSGFDDPFWNYVDEHRAELEELGRRHYGSPRRGRFRR